MQGHSGEGFIGRLTLRYVGLVSTSTTDNGAREKGKIRRLGMGYLSVVAVSFLLHQILIQSIPPPLHALV